MKAGRPTDRRNKLRDSRLGVESFVVEHCQCPPAVQTELFVGSQIITAAAGDSEGRADVQTDCSRGGSGGGEDLISVRSLTDRPWCGCGCEV